MTARSSLLAEATLQPAQHRNLSKVRIGWCDPAPGDRYAPARGCCVSLAGRRRKEHCYAHESPRGLRCVWCGKALSERARGAR